MMHEVKIENLIKDRDQIKTNSVSIFDNFAMTTIKILLLAAVVVLAVAVDAREHYYEVYEPQPKVRLPRDASDYILTENDDALSPQMRFRRDDESARHRRQGGHGGHEGVTGPVHTFVKTDEHAHFKWGVRHHVGHEYAGRR